MVGPWGIKRLKVGVTLGLVLIYSFVPASSQVPPNGVVRVSTGIQNEIKTSFDLENGTGSLGKVISDPPKRKGKQDDGDDGDGGDDGGDDGGGGGGGGGAGGGAGGGFGGAQGALATLARFPQGATQFLTQLTQLQQSVNQQLNVTNNQNIPGIFFNGLQALLNPNARTTPAPAPAAPPAILPGQYPFLPPPYGVSPALLNHLKANAAAAGGAGYYPPPVGTPGGANYGPYPGLNQQQLGGGGANGVGSQYAPNPSQGVGGPFGVGTNNGAYRPQVGGGETYPAQVSGGGFGGFGGGQTQGLQQQLGGGGIGGGVGGGASNFGFQQTQQQLATSNFGHRQPQITQGDLYGQSASLDTEDYPKIQNIDRAPQKIQAPLESPPGGGTGNPEFLVKNETPSNFVKERPSNSKPRPQRSTSPRPRPSLWQLYNNIGTQLGNQNSASVQSETDANPTEVFHRTDDATSQSPLPSTEAPAASFNQPTTNEFYPSSAFSDKGGEQQRVQDVTSSSGYPVVWSNSFYPAEDIVPTVSRRRRRRSTTPTPFY